MSSGSTRRERLSKRIVDGAAKGPTERFVWDSDLPGFGLRITPQGVKSFVFQYRMKGETNSRRYTIGRYGAWTPEAARERCKDLVLLVEAGEHPRDAAKARAAARAKAKLDAKEKEFGAVTETWQKSYEIDDSGRKRRPASISLAKFAVGKLAEKFAGQAIDAIDKSDLRAFFSDMPKDQPATRRNVFAYARILWGWAEHEEIISSNPFHSLKAPKPPASRDRWLRDDELALFWRASRKEAYPFGPFFRLLALTGQRRGEVAGMKWQELDRDAAEWCIPGERTKNRLAHTVPLSEAALSEIASIAPKEEWPKKGLVFTITGNTPISGISKPKLRLDAEVARMAQAEERDPLEPWRIHDLRRSVATGLQRLGVRFEVIEAALNHVSGARGGIAGVYQNHDWAEEKREALCLWAAHIESLNKPKLAVDGAAKGGSPP